MLARRIVFVILLIKMTLLAPLLVAGTDNYVSNNSSSGTLGSGEQKTYRFTKYFNDRFKETRVQQREYEVSGNAESSVMGPANLGGSFSNFTSNYWGFINDLESSTGTSNESTTATQTCAGMIVTSPSGEKAYLPPGLSGKHAASLGRNYRCNGSQWEETTAHGEPGDVAQSNNSCAGATIAYQACTFSFPAMQHTQVTKANFGQMYDNPVDVEGTAAAQCIDGSVKMLRATCEPVDCQEGGTVSWIGADFDHHHQEHPKCHGVVGPEGLTTPDNPPQFFSDIANATEYTRIGMGVARFACTTRGWRVIPDTASCTYKPSTQLTCNKPAFAGDREIYLCN